SGQTATDLTRLAGRAQLYIADGHHRYETAVAYGQEHPEADRVLSFIVSAADPGLTILPTHRIVFGQGRDPGKLVTAWREWFEVAGGPLHGSGRAARRARARADGLHRRVPRRVRRQPRAQARRAPGRPGTR